MFVLLETANSLLYPKGENESLVACLSIINRLKEATMDPLAFVLEVSVSIVRKSHDLTITRPELLKLMLSFWALYIAGRTLVYNYYNRLGVRPEGEWNPG